MNLYSFGFRKRFFAILKSTSRSFRGEIRDQKFAKKKLLLLAPFLHNLPPNPMELGNRANYSPGVRMTSYVNVRGREFLLLLLYPIVFPLISIRRFAVDESLLLRGVGNSRRASVGVADWCERTEAIFGNHFSFTKKKPGAIEMIRGAWTYQWVLIWSLFDFRVLRNN